MGVSWAPLAVRNFIIMNGLPALIRFSPVKGARQLPSRSKSPTNIESVMNMIRGDKISNSAKAITLSRQYFEFKREGVLGIRSKVDENRPVRNRVTEQSANRCYWDRLATQPLPYLMQIIL